MDARSLKGKTLLHSGNFYIYDELLAMHGVTDFDRYAVVPGTKDLIPNFFVD